MHINSHFRRNHRCHDKQSGTALMEFILALPFLFFILILSVNFGRGFLMRQRATMAVRYIAFAQQHRQPQPSDSEISQLFFQGSQTQVVSPSNEYLNSTSCQQAANSADNGNEDNTNSQNLPQASCSVPDDSGIAGFLNSLSGTKRYAVQNTYRPVFAAGDYWDDNKGNWFPSVTITSSLTMDSGDWRHDEMSIWQLAGKLGGGAWGLVPGLFR